MSAHYDTEPPPTASATLHTTVGPIQISLFARQTPLACKNFLQHCLDGYYTGTTFHRIIPNFILQGGDPTGTGSGGSSIYEDAEFEIDPRDGEKVVFGDEIHSRLRFNRRGLLGMAKSEDGSYGSQFFFTLANAERELNKTCTMFGRVEGDGIYNVVKIAEAEVVEGTDRPVYAVKITGCEVGELGPFEGVLKPRMKVAAAAAVPGREEGGKAVTKKKAKKNKGGKALLSFGGDEEEGEGGEAVSFAKPTKPKFNPKLVRDDNNGMPVSKREEPSKPTSQKQSKPPHEASRPRSPRPSSKSPTRQPAPRDPHSQLPLPNEEEPSRSPSRSLSRSPSPEYKSSLSRTNAEIAALKASMRRDTSFTPTEPTRKKSALESMIPETSIRGRKRRAPGNGGDTDAFTSSDKDALKMFNAFKARLENADAGADADGGKAAPRKKARHEQEQEQQALNEAGAEAGDKDKDKDEDEEQQLCDLHFIANCQSCQAWDVADTNATEGDDKRRQNENNDDNNENDTDWMTHTLQFGKDVLGKDLNWKRSNQDADSLVVIDPRQKEKEVIGGRKRERERRRKMEGVREWDQRGR